MPNSRKANVLVVDAEAVARFGLVQLINSQALLRVVGEAETLPVARELTSRLKPEVVVLDLAMGDGVHFIEELVRSKARPKVVAFTALEDALSVQRAFQAGVCGYVTRRDPVADLMAAIVAAVDGKRHVGPRIERVLLERLSCAAVHLGDDEMEVLSQRERQVFRLLGAGHSGRAIAEELGVSVKTVETHRQRIKEKLRLKTGAELNRRAVLAVNGNSH
jgi:DNA-binding NarL/FixJ family response regulator